MIVLAYQGSIKMFLKYHSIKSQTQPLLNMKMNEIIT